MPVLRQRPALLIVLKFDRADRFKIAECPIDPTRAVIKRRERRAWIVFIAAIARMGWP